MSKSKNLEKYVRINLFLEPATLLKIIYSDYRY